MGSAIGACIKGFLTEAEQSASFMVHSANDASVAVAEYVAGSTDAFVTMMNQEVAKLGLENTHYLKFLIVEVSD